MSDIEEAVEQVLRTSDAVTSLVGSSLGVRIFQQRLAQGAILPAVTYQLIADPSDSTHNGPSGLARSRFQFDCWGTTKEEARNVARAVRMTLAGIHRYSAGVLLTGAVKVNESSMFDPDVKKRRRMLDMVIWHSEEVS